jgi:hypothetical protein
MAQQALAAGFRCLERFFGTLIFTHASSPFGDEALPLRDLPLPLRVFRLRASRLKRCPPSGPPWWMLPLGCGVRRGRSRRVVLVWLIDTPAIRFKAVLDSFEVMRGYEKSRSIAAKQVRAAIDSPCGVDRVVILPGCALS